jgi:hypothetical protein
MKTKVCILMLKNSLCELLNIAKRSKKFRGMILLHCLSCNSKVDPVKISVHVSDCRHCDLNTVASVVLTLWQNKCSYLLLKNNWRMEKIINSACVCVCVCARARGGVCKCMCACTYICEMRNDYKQNM